jgi:2-(1,2-epoxy-1,2-dihydrophenyl)acetyl-CoA isomerase
LIAACDIVIAARDTVFSIAYCAIGGVPDSGRAPPSPSSPTASAAELLLLEERFDVQEAKDLGLIGQIVEPDALDATTTALCGKLAAGPTWALGRTKQLLTSAETTPLGLKAFVDRRRPTFVGA